ncbi:MAG: hypothetical protein QGG64_24400, partial [Candidatus Latescibacteria bacterium]|nr:hypothetical protein [Candidatus Latescibacterota bacterium]
MRKFAPYFTFTPTPAKLIKNTSHYFTAFYDYKISIFRFTQPHQMPPIAMASARPANLGVWVNKTK